MAGFPNPRRGENYFDNIHNGYEWDDDLVPWWMGGHYKPDRGHARSAPAEPSFIRWDPIRTGWYQGLERMPKGFRSTKYWARPCDGKRTGALGRLKDGLTGEGPDVYVVINGDRRTKMRDMPHMKQWSGWGGWKYDPNHGQWEFDKDWTIGETIHRQAPWAKRENEKYNFYKREYQDPRERHKHHIENRLWTDAHWAQGAKNSDKTPLSYRLGPNQNVFNFRWWLSGSLPGGRPTWAR